MIIDHSKFVSYTLNFNGCNFITTNYKSAVKQLQNLAQNSENLHKFVQKSDY